MYQLSRQRHGWVAMSGQDNRCYLTQFILASAIAGYLLSLSRRSWHGETRSLPTLLLAGAFTAFACATLLLFLNASLRLDLTICHCERSAAIPNERGDCFACGSQ